jgi:hypothetical protein
MILKIADEYLLALTPTKMYQLDAFFVERSKLGAYAFYEIESPMDLPWLFRTISDRITVIDQLQLEAISG